MPEGTLFLGREGPILSEQVLLQIQGLKKRFPGVLALDDVGFTVEKGEVHALMGENGAGKSTLIKIITGIYEKDEGTMQFDGREVNFQNVKQAQDAGISTIYQELNLIPQLSVAENLFLGRQPVKNGMVAWKHIYSQAEELLNDLGIHVDVKKRLNTYSTAIQQMVAIARAVSLKAKLMIMDEPTSSLGDKEVEILFGLVRKIKSQGIATIFVSHRLDEIFEICDKATILRDGKLVETLPISKLTKLDLITKMIGRDAGDVVNRRVERRKISSEILFEAKNVTRGIKVRGIDLTIRKGEIVGLAGLLGAGRTEFARTVFAADKMEKGTIYIEGKAVSLRTPRAAVKRGIGFLSEDRKAEGIIPNLSVRENMTLTILPSVSKATWIRKKAENEKVRYYSEKLRVKTPGYEQSIGNLSGGNQQKVILARWMATAPKLLILDEPTRGIDVGTKAEIEQLIQEMAKQGISILLISSELEELVRNCDRIAVIQDGRKISELTGDEMSEEAIFQALSASDTQKRGVEE